ncbi:hypothetical protein QOT17_015727 [Balamuthia mandrillaris]
MNMASQMRKDFLSLLEHGIQFNLPDVSLGRAKEKILIELGITLKSEAAYGGGRTRKSKVCAHLITDEDNPMDKSSQRRTSRSTRAMYLRPSPSPWIACETVIAIIGQSRCARVVFSCS